jgi:integrase
MTPTVAVPKMRSLRDDSHAAQGIQNPLVRQAVQRGPIMPSFADAWAVYAAELVRRRCSPASISQYHTQLATWVAWLAAYSVAWVAPGPADLDAFCARACRQGAVHAGLPLAQRTRASYARLVMDWHRVLYAQHVLPSDPMAGYVPPAEPDPDATPLELADVARLFAYLDDQPDPRLPVMARLCYFQALRAGETATIQTQHVQFGPYVVAEVTPTSAEGGFIPRLSVLGKGRLERVWLPLHPALVPVLGRYRYWLAGQLGMTVRAMPAGTPLFGHLGRPYVPLGAKYPSRLLAAAMRAAGVDGRPHDLRRTAAHQVGLAYEDNPGPLKYVLRHRGDGALRHYRQPGLGEGQRYFEQVPEPPTNGEVTR